MSARLSARIRCATQTRTGPNSFLSQAISTVCPAPQWRSPGWFASVITSPEPSAGRYALELYVRYACEPRAPCAAPRRITAHARSSPSRTQVQRLGPLRGWAALLWDSNVEFQRIRVSSLAEPPPGQPAEFYSTALHADLPSSSLSLGAASAVLYHYPIACTTFGVPVTLVHDVGTMASLNLNSNSPANRSGRAAAETERVKGHCRLPLRR